MTTVREERLTVWTAARDDRPPVLVPCGPPTVGVGTGAVGWGHDGLPRNVRDRLGDRIVPTDRGEVGASGRKRQRSRSSSSDTSVCSGRTWKKGRKRPVMAPASVKAAAAVQERKGAESMTMRCPKCNAAFKVVDDSDGSSA